MQHKTKSKTFRRVKVRTVNGVKTVYSKKRHDVKVCAETGAKLNGCFSGNSSSGSKLAKSSKAPSRPFAGVLGPSASRKRFISKARFTYF